MSAKGFDTGLSMVAARFGDDNYAPKDETGPRAAAPTAL